MARHERWLLLLLLLLVLKLVRVLLVFWMLMRMLVEMLVLRVWMLMLMRVRMEAAIQSKIILHGSRHHCTCIAVRSVLLLLDDGRCAVTLAWMSTCRRCRADGGTVC